MWQLLKILSHLGRHKTLDGAAESASVYPPGSPAPQQVIRQAKRHRHRLFPNIGSAVYVLQILVGGFSRLVYIVAKRLKIFMI